MKTFPHRNNDTKSLNRETIVICAKINNELITLLAIVMRALHTKIPEQILNIKYIYFGLYREL